MWTGIGLLLAFQNIDESMPDIIDQFFVIIAKAEFQYFLPVVLKHLRLAVVGEADAPELDVVVIGAEVLRTGLLLQVVDLGMRSPLAFLIINNLKIL